MNDPQLSIDDITDAVNADITPEPQIEYIEPDEQPETTPPDTTELTRRIEEHPELSKHVGPADLARNWEFYKTVSNAFAYGAGSRDDQTRIRAQVMQKIFIGVNMGMTPASAILGINIIKGKVSLSANAMVAMLHAAGWDTKIEESDPVGEWCLFTATKPGRSPVSFRYTIEMARQAGLVRRDGAWTTNPWDMLYARAASVGCRRAEPAVLTGVYSTEDVFQSRRDSPGPGTDMARRIGLSKT